MRDSSTNRRLFKKAVQQGRSERRGESYFVMYVEPLSDARTTLADFFNSLLRRFCQGEGSTSVFEGEISQLSEKGKVTHGGMPLLSTGLFLVGAAWSLFVLASPVVAAECIWAEGTGSVAGDVLTPLEAKQLALRQARAQAIEKAVGMELRAETVVRDFAVASEFIKTLTKGYVRSEQVLHWGQERYQPTAKDIPIPIYRVTLKACVLPIATLRDPGFFVTASVNKGVFTPGEKASLAVTSTRPANVTVYNLTADDQVRPYDGAPWMGLPMKLNAAEPATFPPKGVALEMELPTGHARTAEAFIVVATKRVDHVVLLLHVGTQGTVSLPEFYAALAAVEADVVETIVPYSIIGR